MHWKQWMIAVLLIGLVLPLNSQVGLAAGGAPLPAGCTQRPLADFLDAQGSTTQFFPHRDLLGWTDTDFVTFALVDYTGLVNDFIVDQGGQSLGTASTGRILECPQADGTAEISVVLQTRNALGFAQSVQAIIDNGFDFAGTPTIFGNKAMDVAAGAPAAIGPASLRATFTIAEPGAALPDIQIAFQEQVADFAPISLNFHSTTVGTLPDGTRSRLRVQQVGTAAAGAEEITYTREIVDLSRE